MPLPSFSAHIGYLFTEVPLRQRIAAARAAGFAIGFEYIPSRPTVETLAWMPAWREKLRASLGEV